MLLAGDFDGLAGQYALEQQAVLGGNKAVYGGLGMAGEEIYPAPPRAPMAREIRAQPVQAAVWRRS
jgi:hypothetical protein